MKMNLLIKNMYLMWCTHLNVENDDELIIVMSYGCRIVFEHFIVTLDDGYEYICTKRRVQM